MKRMFLALAIVLVTAGTSAASTRFFFGINLGVPYYYSPAPPAPVYGAPYYGSYFYAPPPPPVFFGGGPVVIIDRPRHDHYYNHPGARGGHFDRNGSLGYRQHGNPSGMIRR